MVCNRDFARLVVTTCVTLAALGLALDDVTAAEKTIRKIDYARDIKPIFSNHCYACHGPDENKRKAELRLDVHGESFEGVVTPGKPDESDLLDRVTSSDPELQMPPAGSKKPSLSVDQIARIRLWIEQGAKIEDH